MTKYIGLDVHVNSTVACIFDDCMNSYKYEKVKTSPAALRRLLKAHSKDNSVRATMEVSGLTANLYDHLRESVDEMVLCNPSQMPWIWRTAKKTDCIDAKKQALLLSVGQIPKVHMPAIEVRQWRMTIQHRRRLVEKRTRVKNRIRSMINSLCLRDKKIGTWWTKKNIQWLRTLTDMQGAIPLSDQAALQLLDMIDELEFFNAKVKYVTERLDRIAENHPGVHLLMTIPGVGPRTAEAVLAYTDEVDRFKRSKQYASYFGMTPKLDESASTRRLGHISKRGPSVVRWLIVESAWRAVKFSPALRAFYTRVMRGQKGRKKVAIVATARKVLTIMRMMLITGEVYNEKLVNNALAALPRPLK